MRSLRKYFPYASLVCILAFGSCSKEAPTAPIPVPPPPSSAGYWTGTLTMGNLTGNFTLQLTQNLTHIEGNGVLDGTGVAIAGENNYPKVTFTCTTFQYYPFTFTGQFTSPTELSGLVNGSGFINAYTQFSKVN